MFKLAVFVGSTRPTSSNLKFARALERLAAGRLAFHYVDIASLPYYDDSLWNDPPAEVLRLKREIAEADGVLFVTPEYNRSIPGVLKNAIDNASRPPGQSAWTGKPAGILGVSTGPIGTAAAQQHLRNILAVLNVPTLCQPEAFIQMKEGLFDGAGNIGADSKQFLQNWMDKYVEWVQKYVA